MAAAFILTACNSTTNPASFGKGAQKVGNNHNDQPKLTSLTMRGKFSDQDRDFMLTQLKEHYLAYRVAGDVKDDNGKYINVHIEHMYPSKFRIEEDGMLNTVLYDDHAKFFGASNKFIIQSLLKNSHKGDCDLNDIAIPEQSEGLIIWQGLMHSPKNKKNYEFILKDKAGNDEYWFFYIDKGGAIEGKASCTFTNKQNENITKSIEFNHGLELKTGWNQLKVSRTKNKNGGLDFYIKEISHNNVYEIRYELIMNSSNSF